MQRYSTRVNANTGAVSGDRIANIGEAPPQSDAKPKAKSKGGKERQRIFISSVNSLVGHALFESMRNDHLALRTGKKAHKFSGTVNQRDAASTPVPSDSIKILDCKRKPKSFGKAVIGADTVVVDLLSGCDLAEAEHIIQIMR